MSGVPSEIDAFVRSKFDVRDSFALPGDEAEYRVAYGPSTKMAFAEFRSRVAAMGYVPYLTGTKQDCVLSIRKPPVEARRFRSLALVAAIASLTSVLVFTLLEGDLYQQFAPPVPEAVVFLAYGLGVALVIVVHELGHQLAARKAKEPGPTSYIVPGVPGLTAFLPVVGAISGQKDPALNRDKLFDVLLWGPLLAFVASVALFLVGEFTAVTSSVQVQGNLLVGSNITVSEINPSVLQFVIGLAIGPLTPPTPSGFVGLSPLADAATVGFLLTFINFLPMATFDGGVLSTMAWGGRGARALTYASAFLLVSLDTPNYWAIGIFVLLLAWRQSGPRVLDAVSDLTPRRRWVYIGVLVLAFLCVPLPQNIATIPLG